MSGTCEQCGGPVETKNNVGHWRWKCWDCIEAVAADEPASHPPCGDPGCEICQTR